MKKVFSIISVAIFATALFTSCGPDCDPTDPQSECYEAPPCDPTDPNGDCYEDPRPSLWVEINGVRWAPCNVDAPGTFAVAPEASGMFYQWNRKIGWSSEDPMVDSNGGNKWNAAYPEGTEWEKANDPCPFGWRVPTIEELRTLFDIDNVSHEWTTRGDVNGRLFTDIVSNASLFLPAAGNRDGSDDGNGRLFDFSIGGNYWSSTQNSTVRAYYLYFYESHANWGYPYSTYGFSVRCVAE